MIAIYNTLTRKKEEFKPLEKGKIKMYVCGPTVYDVPHIGHVRSAYVFDVIRRYFEYAGYNVLFVRNVTDIDDKIIKKAADEITKSGEGHSAENLKEKVKSVAVRYYEHYIREMDAFGILRPVIEPKATEYIAKMIKFIESLIEKGYAYPSGGDVYFDVNKFPGYGKLSHQNIDELMHGARILPGEKKQNPLDFALWKEAKAFEPSWQSPWGEGRPGWHIECSVMSVNILGPKFDIHGGGLDLIFPHHENEIAQAEAETGESFANYWIHNGLLTVSDEKMSKSLGNFITVSDFLAKHKDPDLLKMAFLGTHYRSPMDYSDEKMEEAHRAKERILIFKDRSENAQKGGEEIAASLKEKFIRAMEDDFNTPVALSVIFEAVKTGNELLASNSSGALRKLVLELAGILGLNLHGREVDSSEAKKIEILIAEREEARKRKDWGASDKARNELLAMGVIVEDTPKGPVWRKK